jgi:hypothetical protein
MKASVIATMNSRDGRLYGLKDETEAKQLARTLQQAMPDAIANLGRKPVSERAGGRRRAETI